MQYNGGPIIIYSSKGDLESAFRVLPLNWGSWAWLIMMAQHPESGEWQFFVDKCLPFGSSISCAHFQRVSNGLRHIIEVKTLSVVTNYLDDFFFIALTIIRCNHLIEQFICICHQICFPVSHEKTVWASEITVFLGVLLNGRDMLICLHAEKRIKAVEMLLYLKDKRKATVKELQVLCGYLNFLSKAIFPGRAFTRRMYAKYAGVVRNSPGSKLRQYHHVRLDYEFKLDCQV